MSADVDLHGDDPGQDAGLISPAERRKRRVRDQIIEAAEAVFTEEGEAGLSMRRLAERIDYSPAAIYKYFASKEDLIQAIREQFFERLLTRLSAVTLPHGGRAQDYTACLRTYVDCGLERPNHYRMAFVGSPGAPRPPGEDTKAFEAVTMLEFLIASGVAAGAFRPVDPAITARSVWSSLHGLTMLMVAMPDFPGCMVGGERVSRDEIIDFHMDLITRGLSAR